MSMNYPRYIVIKMVSKKNQNSGLGHVVQVLSSSLQGLTLVFNTYLVLFVLLSYLSNKVKKTQLQQLVLNMVIVLCNK